MRSAVNILGLSGGEGIEHGLESLDLSEGPAHAKRAARSLARRYLDRWHNVDTVVVRREDDHHAVLIRVKRRKGE